MMNLKGIMKQKTLGEPKLPSFAPASGAPASGGFLKKKKPVADVQPVPSLMKRLTGK